LSLASDAVEFPTECRGEFDAYIKSVAASMDTAELEVVARLAGWSTRLIHDLPLNRPQHEELHCHEGGFAAVPSL
jgi:hypothetical protein